MARVFAIPALSLDDKLYDFEKAIRENIEFVYISIESFKNKCANLEEAKTHDYVIVRYTPKPKERVAYIFMVMSEVESIGIKKLPDYRYWEDDSPIRSMDKGIFLKTRFIEQCDPEKYCNYRDGRVYHITDEGFNKFKNDFNVLSY